MMQDPRLRSSAELDPGPAMRRHAPNPKALISIHQAAPGNRQWAKLKHTLKTDPHWSRMLTQVVSAIALGAISGQLYHDSASEYFNKVQPEHGPFANLIDVNPIAGEIGTVVINGILTGNACVRVVLPLAFNIVVPEEVRRQFPEMYWEQQTWTVYFGQYGAVLLPLSAAIASGVPLALLEKSVAMQIVQLIIQGGIFHSWSFIEAAERGSEAIDFLSRPLRKWATGKSDRELAIDGELADVRSQLSSVFRRAAQKLETLDIPAFLEFQTKFSRIISQATKDNDPEAIIKLAIALTHSEELQQYSPWVRFGLFMSVIGALGLTGYYALTWSTLEGSLVSQLARFGFYSTPFTYLVMIIIADKVSGALTSFHQLFTGNYHSSATNLLGKASILFIAGMVLFYAMGMLSASSLIALMYGYARQYLKNFLQPQFADGFIKYFLQYDAIFIATLFNASPVAGMLTFFTLVGFKYLACDNTKKSYASLNLLFENYANKIGELNPASLIEAILQIPDSDAELRFELIHMAFKCKLTSADTVLQHVPNGQAVADLLRQGNAKIHNYLRPVGNPKQRQERIDLDTYIPNASQILRILRNDQFDPSQKPADLSTAEKSRLGGQLNSEPQVLQQVLLCFAEPEFDIEAGQWLNPPDQVQFVLTQIALERAAQSGQYGWTVIHQLLHHDVRLANAIVEYVFCIFQQPGAAVARNHSVESFDEIRAAATPLVTNYHHELALKQLLGGREAFELLGKGNKPSCLNKLGTLLAGEPTLRKEIETLLLTENYRPKLADVFQDAQAILIKAGVDRYLRGAEAILWQRGLQTMVAEKRELQVQREADTPPGAGYGFWTWVQKKWDHCNHDPAQAPLLPLSNE